MSSGVFRVLDLSRLGDQLMTREVAGHGDKHEPASTTDLQYRRPWWAFLPTASVVAPAL